MQALAATPVRLVLCWDSVRSLLWRAQVSEKAISHPDAKTALRAVMRGWLPLSEAVLSMATEQLPSPLEAAPERVPHLLSLDALEAAGAPRLPADMQQVRAPWLYREGAVGVY